MMDYYILCCSCWISNRLCCSCLRNRWIQWECGSAQQHRTVSCLKIGCAWAISGGLGGPLGLLRAWPVLPKPNLAGSYPGTWFSLLESCVWICGTPIRTCSKGVALVCSYHFLILIMYALLKNITIVTQIHV
jgi:hypothetical protein